MTFQCPVPLGEVFAGKYRVDRVLGEGGMGVVVAAHHLELDQTVAVKFLLDDVAKNAEGAERFRREARAAAKIQSDHVVRVLDVGLLDSGERYMVMEYLDGHDLSEELRLRGPQPVDVAVRYLLEALDAITQAHAHGIVHRDLKPANLYLARRLDGSSRIKVLDFGISKSMSSNTADQLSLTRTSAWIGSPLYMAPEQMQSARDVDLRADIWSLGAILYEMISGQPPYPAESLPQLCNLMLTRDPQPLIELCPDVPTELNACVMRCLSRSLETRFQTATELRVALAELAPAAPGRASFRSAVSLAATDVLTGQGTRTGGPSDARTQSSDQSSQSGAVPQRTAGAWGGTGSGEVGSRRRLWFGLSAAAVIGVAGVALLSRGSDPVPSVAGAEPSMPPVAAAPPAAPPSEPVEPAAPSSAPEATPVEPAPAPSAAAAAEASSSPAQTTATKPAAAKPVATKPTSAKKPVRPAPAAPTTPSDGISDFGGRR